MVTHRRLASAFVLGCLLLCFLEPHSASGSAEGEDQHVETFFAGGRHLLQDDTPCPHQWGLDNFTVLEENCPYIVNLTTYYDKKRCCQEGLGGMLCPYLDLVNDPTNNCARSFWAVLSIVAPNYTDDWFSNICTDPNSPSGVECPANLTRKNSAPSPPANFSPSSHTFGLSLLLAVAIFEILVLLF